MSQFGTDFMRPDTVLPIRVARCSSDTRRRDSNLPRLITCRPLKTEALADLHCPIDQSPALRLKASESAGGDVISGRIECDACGTNYPIVSGLPHLVSWQKLSPEALASRAREREARDADSDHYDSTISSGHHAIEVKAIVSALRPRRGEKVVDLGAGTGRLTVALALTGARVIACDLSPRSLLINRRKCEEARVGERVIHVVADACRLPIRDSAADKLGSGMLLEHIFPADERKRCVDEIHRVLRDGGRMALTAYNYSWSMNRRRAPREGMHQGDLYFHRFDRDELAGLLAEFTRSRVSGILNLPSRLAFPALDRVVSAMPPLATRSGDLLFAVASR